MRLRPFALSEPGTVGEAVAALAAGDGEARLVAGGTALVPMIRLGLVAPDRLVSLHRVAGLRGVSTVHGHLELGAMTTYGHVERHPDVRRGWPLLALAAGRVASPAVRSMGTVGGNLAYAEAASDVSPALLCLEAGVRVAGPRGERTVPIGELFRGFYETALEPGEIVTAVRVPALPAGARSGYVKFCSRSAEDKPLVGVAAVLRMADGGTGCAEARIGLGGAAPTPIRAPAAESALRGAELTDATIARAAEAAAAEAEPLSDVMGSADYRRRMIRVWVRRLLADLRAGRAVVGSPS
ncbi:MAG TPA: xanthine dehydrogenase family protein subunit M [Candidatus Bathyarchaeia archaeon]|nr:xanthine dehydrogenase family protein subunit M [Candidatus Bathyarchaeia archaeon]